METDMTEPRPALVLFTADLRCDDQPALAAAAESGRPVLPLFILDETTPGRWQPGGASRWWLHHSLAALAGDLAALGLPLILRRGPLAETALALARESAARTLHVGRAVEPWLREALDHLRREAARHDIEVFFHETRFLIDPAALRTGEGGVYGVYTPFARAAFSALAALPPPRPAPLRCHPPSRLPPSLPLAALELLPRGPDWAGGLRATWRPGAEGGAARQAAFLPRLAQYHRLRDIPAEEGTSRLSPHLHWGEIPIRRLWYSAASAPAGGEGARKFLSELLWREFAAYLLWHHPALPEEPWRAEFARFPWRPDPALFRAWSRGLTGIPLIDAAMRALWHEGWLHNRLRMITASFLVKHLLIPWQEGEAWFWDTLVDADLASNAASWQWVAGSGADAAPYFRIFNPLLQARKFDPDGRFVRRWLPELAKLPLPYLHAPWEAPPLLLAEAGVRLGTTYPCPLVDLGKARARALAAYAALRRGESGGPGGEDRKEEETG